MDSEDLRKKIKASLESIVTTIDPAFDLDSAITVYFKVLNYQLKIPRPDDLDGLKDRKMNTLNEVFVLGNLSSRELSEIGTFNQKIEPFIKKLYYLLEEFGFIIEANRIPPDSQKTLASFLNAINKANPYYLDKDGQPTLVLSEAKKDSFDQPIYKKYKGTTDLQYERLYKANKIKLDDYKSLRDVESSPFGTYEFQYYFLKSYVLRNQESHQAPGLNVFNAINNLKSTLITELWFVYFLKEKLIKGMLSSQSEEMDFSEYIENELSKIKDITQRFVPLSLKLYSNKGENNFSTSIEEIKNNTHLRLRILGEGGSGKTTSLQNLVFQTCLDWKKDKSKNKIPVLLFLSNLHEDETILDGIGQKMSINQEIVNELIEKNSLILFLDGVNEIVKNRESKKKRIKEISSLIADNDQLEIVITDRYEFDSYQNDYFNVPSYGIQKLNESQIEEFVHKYALNSEKSSDRILGILRSKSNIKNLINRPLLLSRAIEIIESEDSLPDKEGQIIEKFIDLMLRREKDEKMDPLLNIDDFKLLLGFVANQIYLEFKTNKPINELKFKKFINKGVESIGIEKSNAGYTLRIGYELEILSRKDELMQFFHESYFEFFVSYYTKFEML